MLKSGSRRGARAVLVVALLLVVACNHPPRPPEPPSPTPQSSSQRRSRVRWPNASSPWPTIGPTAWRFRTESISGAAGAPPDQRFPAIRLGEALGKTRRSSPACRKLRTLETVSTQDQALGAPAMRDALKAHGRCDFLISTTTRVVRIASYHLRT